MARKISVQILGDASSLERAFRQSSSSARAFNRNMEHTGRVTNKTGGVLRTVGKNFLAGALGGVGIGYLGKAVIDAASTVQEETEKTGVIFGRNAIQVQAWAKTLANSFGVSEGAALQATGQFGNMFNSLGIGQKQSAGMSTRLVELAADMASFNNAKPDEVLQALSSGLAGQVRPLRRFGVFIDQARIKAEALSSGIVKASVDTAKVQKYQVKAAEDARNLAEAIKKHGANSLEAAKAQAQLAYDTEQLAKAEKGVVPQLTASQKVQAAYNIVLKDTRAAQGDVARNTSSLSVAQSKFNAALQNTEAVVGAQFLPMLTRVLNVGAQWLGQSKNQEKIQRTVRQVIRSLASALRTVRDVIRAVNRVTGSFGNTLKLLIGTIIVFKALKFASTVAGIARSFGLLGARSRGANAGMKSARGGAAAFRLGLVGKAGLVVAAGAAAFALTTLILKVTGLDKKLRAAGGAAFDAAAKLGLVNDPGKQFEGKSSLGAGGKQSAAMIQFIRNSLAKLEARGLSPQQAANAFLRTHPNLAKHDVQVLAGVYGTRPQVTHVHTTVNLDGKTVAKSTTEHQRKHAKRNTTQRGGRLAGAPQP